MSVVRDRGDRLSTNASGTARVTIEDAPAGYPEGLLRRSVYSGEKLADKEDAQGQTFVYLPLDEIVRDGSASKRGRTKTPRKESS